MLFDNVPSVLRAVCTAMSENKEKPIPLPEHNKYGFSEKILPLVSIEFSTLVNHVLNNVSEPRDSSEQRYKFSQTAELDDTHGKRKFLVLDAEPGQKSSLPKVDDVVILSYESGKKDVRSSVVQIVDSKFYLDPHKGAGSVSVYHATPVIAAANSLRVKRNSFAHAPFAQLEDKEFKKMVQQVQIDYKVLMDKFAIGEDVRQDLIAKFKEIINSMSIYIYESASYGF